MNSSQLAFSARRAKYRADYTGTSGYFTDPATITIYMNKDDYIWCRNKYAGKIIHSNPTYCYFCGHFVGWPINIFIINFFNMDYTITLTDTEKKCMDYVTSDIDEWITNAAQSRAYVAKQEILTANTEYCNNNSIAIAVGEDAQVTQAFSVGAVTKA